MTQRSFRMRLTYTVVLGQVHGYRLYLYNWWLQRGVPLWCGTILYAVLSAHQKGLELNANANVNIS